jgi:hypothetical protein
MIAVRVDILDFEGAGGDTPTSVLIVQGSFGDIVIRQAAQIGVVQTVEVTEDTPGQFTGFPIGPILGLRLQAFSEGNSVFPSEVGAYFDNLNAEIRDLEDLTLMLSNFGAAC